MNTSESQILELISKGEGLDLEFKACLNQLNRDVYETVCSFLNRHGGTLLLGVQDNGVIQGIEPDAAAQIRKDFVTAINNPQKISPPTYLAVDEVTVDGKPLLRIYVPESSQVHRCNGRIYDRNEDGDIALPIIPCRLPGFTNASRPTTAKTGSIPGYNRVTFVRT